MSMTHKSNQMHGTTVLCVRKDGIAHAGIVHNGRERWDEGKLSHCVRKVGFRNFQVEKREGTPYRTHSYLPGGDV